MCTVYRLLLVFVTGINPAFAFDHGHTLYDELLDEVVIPHKHQTSVDYTRLKANPEKLNRYINEIKSVTKSGFDSWNAKQQLAFLINVYNALTLKLIIDHYPGISSIRDLGGLIFSSPWDRKFFRLFGKDTSLDYVEHELIRKNYNEPRIHFAVNCASRSCPPLMKDAYIADKLEQQLENATLLFLTDPERNRFDPEKKILELSSIFKWYKQDFISAAGSVQLFVAPYITGDPEASKLQKSGSEHKFSTIHVRFLDYDWSLNDANIK